MGLHYEHVDGRPKRVEEQAQSVRGPGQGGERLITDRGHVVAELTPRSGIQNREPVVTWTICAAKASTEVVLMLPISIPPCPRSLKRSISRLLDEERGLR
jgi:hypothetical protein